MDTLTPEQRSERMARIRSKDTRPELFVRRLVFRLGYRYRLHARDLPGRPDIVFRTRRKVIFVHGCFWHHHVGCRLGRIPKSRLAFWRPKLMQNQKRDKINARLLVRAGWEILELWQCQLSSPRLSARITGFLDG